MTVVWAALLLAAGASQLAAAWAGWLPLVVLTAAAVLPLLLIVLAGRLRLPAGRTVLILVAFLAAGAYLATRGAGVVTDAVPRLLTGPRPAPATPDALLPGALAAALAGLWTGVRVRRDGSALITPPVAAAALYTGGLLLTAGTADRNGLAAAGLLLVTLAGWVLLRRPAPAVPATLPAIACCAGVALLTGTFPVAGAFDPRTLVTPPSFTVTEANPLSRLAGWAKAGDVELFSTNGQSRPLRLVALAEFTGAGWRPAGVYRPLGTVEEPALPQGQRRTDVDVEVHVAALEGQWLPVGGAPAEVSLHDIAVDPDSGSTAVRDGLRAGMRYRMRGTVDAARPEELAAAGVPGAETAAGYLATPGMPWQLAEYARQVTRNASTPYEQAVALEYAVRSGRTVDPVAPSGSSYARLTTFLAGPAETPGGQAGTSEQFASAFAVLARAVALPTRIVVGFRPGQPDANGELIVRGRDALAWPEVYFTGWGWQPFQPTPTAGVATDAADEEAKRFVLAQLAERAEIAVQSAQPPPTKTPPAPPAPATAAPDQPVPAESHWQTRTFAIIGAILLTPLALLATARAWRRARHRRAGALGAWSEVLDLLVLLGRPAPRSEPAPETAAALATRLPGAADLVVRLAEAADRVRFGPGPHLVDPRAWPILRQLRRAARRATPWHRRLFWAVDPRPLRRR